MTCRIRHNPAAMDPIICRKRISKYVRERIFYGHSIITNEHGRGAVSARCVLGVRSAYVSDHALVVVIMCPGIFDSGNLLNPINSPHTLINSPHQSGQAAKLAKFAQNITVMVYDSETPECGSDRAISWLFVMEKHHLPFAILHVHGSTALLRAGLLHVCLLSLSCVGVFGLDEEIGTSRTLQAW